MVGSSVYRRPHTAPSSSDGLACVRCSATSSKRRVTVDLVLLDFAIDGVECGCPVALDTIVGGFYAELLVSSRPPRGGLEARIDSQAPRYWSLRHCGFSHGLQNITEHVVLLQYRHMLPSASGRRPANNEPTERRGGPREMEMSRRHYPTCPRLHQANELWLRISSSVAVHTHLGARSSSLAKAQVRHYEPRSAKRFDRNETIRE